MVINQSAHEGSFVRSLCYARARK